MKMSENKIGIRPNSVVKLECSASIECNTSSAYFQWDHMDQNGGKTKNIIRYYRDLKKYPCDSKTRVLSSLNVTVLPDAHGVYICRVFINYRDYTYRFYRNTTITAGNYILVVQLITFNNAVNTCI